jgi:hypothetical protein
VPLSGRKRPKEAPSRRYRAGGENLEAERKWFVEEGCPGENGVRMRRARLSNPGAATAWERFLCFVQFTDECLGAQPGQPSPGCLPRVVDYLDMGYVNAYFEYYRDADKVTKNYKGPFSSGWIETIQRTLSALRDPFLKPALAPEALQTWKAEFKQAVAQAKTEAESSVATKSLVRSFMHWFAWAFRLNP